MTTTATVPARTHRIHPAWWVAAVTFLALVGAAAFRAVPGVLIDPYLPQPGQHVGRRIIKIEDTPDELWLDAAKSMGVPWADRLGLECSDTGV